MAKIPRSSVRLIVLIGLCAGMIGAGGEFKCASEGVALFRLAIAELASATADQQEQIDQLTAAVCGLSEQTGYPAPAGLCELVVTAVCESGETAFRCQCDPGLAFVVESCDEAEFPCVTEPGYPPCRPIEGCRATLTRVAAGDASDVEVFAECGGGCPDCGPDPGPQPSSIRYKLDVRDMGEASNVLMKLRPVSYRYREEYRQRFAGRGSAQQYGLIAEEVVEVAPDLVALDEHQEPVGVYYQRLSPMLLNEFQKQQRTIVRQREVVAALAARLEAVESRLARQSSAQSGLGDDAAALD
jgi:hypothetical protein